MSVMKNNPFGWGLLNASGRFMPSDNAKQGYAAQDQLKEAMRAVEAQERGDSSMMLAELSVHFVGQQMAPHIDVRCRLETAADIARMIQALATLKDIFVAVEKERADRPEPGA